MKKFYFLMFAACMGITASAENILILMGADYAQNNDKQICNAISAMGYNIDTMSIYYASSVNLADYDAAVITETPGSSAVDNNFLPAYYQQIPVLNLKGYALQKTNIKWLENNITFMPFTAPLYLNNNSNVPLESEIEIAINHPVFTNVGKAGDVFSFASDILPGTNPHFQVVDCPNSIVSDISNNAVSIGKSKFVEDDPYGTIASNGGWAGESTILNAIEENSTCMRSVVFGIHSLYALTTESETIIQNSINWIMKKDISGVIYDTIYIYDTITVYDSITVFDTITEYDTVHVVINDTSFIDVYNYISVTDTLFIDVDLTDIGKPDVYNRIKVYPNPAKDIIYVNTGEFYNDITNYKLRIISNAGKIVFTTDIIIPEIQIDVNEFKSVGLYFIQVLNSSGDIVSNKKLILE